MVTNLFLVDYTLQKGRISTFPQAFFEAIRLNDVEVQMNCQAVQWGWLDAINLPLVKEEANKNLKENDDYYLS